MKTMIRYLFDKNKIALIVSVVLMALMLVDSALLAWLLNVALLTIAYYKIIHFIPYRFNYDDGRKDYSYYQLLPIDSKRFKVINGLNILLWTVIVFVSSLFVTRFSKHSIQLDGIVLILFNSFIIPLLYGLFEGLRKPIDRDTWGIGGVFTGLGQLVVVLFLNDIITQKNRIYLYFIAIIIVFIIYSYLREWEGNTKNTDFTFGLNNRYINIYRTSRFYFGKRYYITEIGTGWVWFWAMRGDLLLIIFGMIVVNALLIISTVGSFYEEQSFIALLPVSLKEKKLTANIVSLLSIIFYNVTVCLLFLIFHQSELMVATNLLIGSITLSYLAYSLFVTYYHRGKNWIFAPTLSIAFILLVALGYSIYPTYGNSIYLPVVILTIILLIIDYNHHYETSVLV